MKKYTNYILLIPCTLFLTITLGFGIVTSITQSLGYIPFLNMNEITLNHYANLFNDESFITSITFTLKVSFISSIISLCLGVTLAYVMYKNYSKFNLTILKVPIIIPHIIVVLIILTLFSQGGMLSRLLFNIGIINSPMDFPLMVNDVHGIGIILTYVWKEIPFITLVTYGIMTRIDKGYIHIAKSLGATELYILLKIILPICKRSLVSTFLIVFAFSFSSFEVPFLIGSPSKKTLSLKAYIEYSRGDLFNRPYAMTINVVLSFIGVVLLIIYHILTKKSSKEGI